MNKSKIKIILASLVLFIAIAPLSVYGYSYHSYEKNLNHAKVLLSNEQYDTSIDAFRNLKSSKFSNNDSKFIDSNIRLALELKKSKKAFNNAVQLFSKKDYIDSINNFRKVKKSDKKRYVKAQAQIKKASELYISDNITKAKAQADNKKYDTAITFLDTILKFDKNSKEAANLKDSYNKEIEKIKAEEAIKQASPETPQKQSEAAKVAQYASSSSNRSSSAPKNCNISPDNTSGYTVTSCGNGWFSVKLNSGVPTPEGFGIRFMSYAFQPNGIYYDFVGSSTANIQYQITFHLATRNVTETGTASNDTHLIPASTADVPQNQAIVIDISANYKGKIYSDSFSRVINSSY